MRDVARAAGVSQTTVSFVLNEVPDVHIGQATRERVLATIEQLGYRPNAVARGLRRAKTDTIGFIWHDPASLAGRMVQGAQEAACARGSLVLLAGTGGDVLVEQNAGATLIDRRVDGIVCATRDHRVVAPAGHLRSVPSVLLGCEAADQSVPAVVADQAAAALEGTSRMFRTGRQRVAFLSAAVGTPTTRSRLAGYRRALVTRGVRYEHGLVRRCRGERAAYDATRSLMAEPHPPDGLLCHDLEIAAGAYRAISDARLAIPGDIAVVAFDDHEVSASLLHPALSTIGLPHYEMGRLAVETLFEFITADAVPGGQRRVHCPYYERQSV
jgi:LacI family transcriptional regulator